MRTIAIASGSKWRKSTTENAEVHPHLHRRFRISPVHARGAISVLKIVPAIRLTPHYGFGGGFFFAGAAGLGGGASGASCATTGLGANFGSETPCSPDWICTEIVLGA
jgi:hypothetical protein